MKTYLKICARILGIIALQSFKQQDHRQDFIQKAIMSNRFEIALAEQAINKSDNVALQELGRKLVEDHQKNLSELEAYANANELSFPKELDEEHQGKLESFATLDKGAYDRSFKEAIVGSHEQSIALYEGIAEESLIEDEELKKWVSEKLPSLRSHLDRSKSLSLDTSTVMPRTFPPITDSITEKFQK